MRPCLVPQDRAGVGADPHALPIEKEGQRQGFFLQTGRNGPPLIEVCNKGAEFQFFKVWQNDFCTAMIHRNRQYINAHLLQGGGQGGKRGEFLYAWSTPCCPQMHDGGASTAIGQRMLDSVPVREGFCREGTRWLALQRGWRARRICRALSVKLFARAQACD